MNNIRKNLLNLGFKQKEVEVYLALLRLGRASPVQIAVVTKINRVTVYIIAKKLVAKGIIAEDLGGKNVSLVALPPTELVALIEKEKVATEKKEVLVNQTVAELSHLFKTEKFSIPRIRFIDEEQVEEHMHSRVKEWSKDALMTDSTCWGFQDHTFVENYRNWLEWFWKHDNFGLIVKLLSNNSQIEQALKGIYSKREIKFWNKTSQFTASTWIVGSYVIMVNTRVHPFYLVEIKDATLAHNLREVFKNIWDDIK